MSEQQMETFLTRMAHRFTPGVRYISAADGLFAPGDYAQARMPAMTGASLFTYLFRRFGYPCSGWDDYKALACYILTTPEPDCFLTISPYCGGGGHDAWLSFGYCCAQAFDDAFIHSMRRAGYDAWEQSDLCRRGTSALERAIDDLLRPTNIRDVLINCCGPLGQTEDLPEMVAPFAGAGYGIPAALLEDTDRYSAFLDALCTLGEGDTGRGIEAVIASVQAGRTKEGEQAE